MSDKSLFGRNLLIIAGCHILLVVGFFFLGYFSNHTQTVTWLDGGGSPATQAPKQDNSEPDSTPDENTPAPSPEKTPEESGTAPPSMIALGTPAPRPTIAPTPRPRTPTPTPRPSATPRPATPTPSATPKRATPTATPKKKPSASPSPKASPKKSASPSPKASPKHSASPAESATPKPSATEGDNNSEVESGTAVTSGTTNSKGKPGTHPGQGGGDRGGVGNAGGGKEKVDWYNAMIHDRFYSHWVRPNIDVPDGSSISTIVKIRIQRDGHISDVSLATPSGNAMMDESVLTAAKSVTQIDPLPSAIEGSFYDVRIEFKLGDQ